MWNNKAIESGFYSEFERRGEKMSFNCPIDYNLDKCSSKEYGLTCDTCFHSGERKHRRVGKRVGNNLYIHLSAIDTLSEQELSLVQQKLFVLPADSNYYILKINIKESKVSFIDSLDWDIASEPEVGDCYSVNEKNEVEFIKSKGQIYHHKWQFVKEDYEYFDVAESKRWSDTWQNSDVVKQLKIKDKNYLCKIGYRDYFDREIKNKILNNKEEERR